MSSRQLSQFSVMRTLVKREFQEHRVLFVFLPVALALLLALQFGATVVSSYVNDVFLLPFHPPKDRVFHSGAVLPGILVTGSLIGATPGTVTEFAAQPERMRAMIMDNIYSGNLELLMMIYWAVMPFYFLMTLYQQRKDRSILFWNSMPVSNAQTIVSKVLAGMIGCQATFLVCMLLLSAFKLLVSMAYGSLYPIDVWQTLVAPSHVFSNDFTLLVHAVRTTVWTLPAYTWLLLASAGSRSMPFAWAAGPLMLVVGVEFLVSQSEDFVLAVLGHIWPLPFPHNIHMFRGTYSADLTVELALCIVLGLALAYAAIRLNRSEDI